MIFSDFKIINTSVVLNFLSTTAPLPIHAPALIYALINGGSNLNSSSLLMFSDGKISKPAFNSSFGQVENLCGGLWK